MLLPLMPLLKLPSMILFKLARTSPPTIPPPIPLLRLRLLVPPIGLVKLPSPVTPPIILLLD